MTIQQLKEEYGIYFETFWYVQTNWTSSRDTGMHWFCNDEDVTEKGLKYFIDYIESLKRVEGYEERERNKRDRPFFNIIDGEAVCPICEGKVYRSPEVMLPRHPIFSYYCNDCDYYIQSRLVPKETKLDEELLKRMECLYKEEGLIKE